MLHTPLFWENRTIFCFCVLLLETETATETESPIEAIVVLEAEWRALILDLETFFDDSEAAVAVSEENNVVDNNEIRWGWELEEDEFDRLKVDSLRRFARNFSDAEVEEEPELKWCWYGDSLIYIWY